VSANHKFLNRQAAQLQREAGSARLRSGGRAALVDPQGPGASWRLQFAPADVSLVAASAMPRATSSRGPGAAAYAESLARPKVRHPKAHAALPCFAEQRAGELHELLSGFLCFVASVRAIRTLRAIFSGPLDVVRDTKPSHDVRNACAVA
jgi:hypothetical protein